MAESFNKKEKQKRKKQKREEKESRKAERKANARNGNSLDDMIAYVDENGNLSSVPPDEKRKAEINESEIVIGSRNIEGAIPERTRKGKVTFFNSQKGYGFIRDLKTQESIFVHQNSVNFPINDNDTVYFETERGVKGLNAINVRKNLD